MRIYRLESLELFWMRWISNTSLLTVSLTELRLFDAQLRLKTYLSHRRDGAVYLLVRLLLDEREGVSMIS